MKRLERRVLISELPARRRGAVTFSGFLLLMILLGVLFLTGLHVADYGRSRFGWPGFALGFPIGVVGAFIALSVTVRLVSIMLSFWEGLFTGLPWLPTCGNGRCRAGLLMDLGDGLGDYEIHRVGDDLGHRCRCGWVYLRRRKERRLYEVLPDGSVRPYMM